MPVGHVDKKCLHLCRLDEYASVAVLLMLNVICALTCPACSCLLLLRCRRLSSAPAGYSSDASLLMLIVVFALTCPACLVCCCVATADSHQRHGGYSGGYGGGAGGGGGYGGGGGGYGEQQRV
jgi:uncharacterized membrane protein YgcG